MQSNKNEIDPIGLVLTLFLFVIFFVRILFPGIASSSATQPLFYAVSIFYVGVYLAYFGTKRFRMLQTQQSDVHWYTQPQLLVALGAFLAVPFYLVLYFDTNLRNANTNTSNVPILLFAPSILCLLAALYFYVRGFVLRRRTRKL